MTHSFLTALRLLLNIRNFRKSRLWKRHKMTFLIKILCLITIFIAFKREDISSNKFWFEIACRNITSGFANIFFIELNVFLYGYIVHRINRQSREFVKCFEKIKRVQLLHICVLSIIKKCDLITFVDFVS